MSIEIRGAERLGVLAKALNDAAERDLRQVLARRATSALRPVKDAVKESAVRTLPRAGGLNRRVAGSRIITRRRPQGVRLVARSRDSLSDLDQGRLRHPVFGNRAVWVDQTVRRGWWTRPTKAAGRQVKRALVKVVDDIARKISRAR